MVLPVLRRARALRAALLLAAIALSACGSDSEQDSAVPIEVPDNYQPSIVVAWNELALNAVATTPAKPTVVSRQMFMLQTAVYDAWSVYDEAAVPVHLDPAIKAAPADRTEANKAAAVSQAAYHVLIAEFADFERSTGALSARMQALGYPILAQGDTVSPEGIGFLAAQAVRAARAADGANADSGIAVWETKRHYDFIRPASAIQHRYYDMPIMA